MAFNKSWFYITISLYTGPHIHSVREVGHITIFSQWDIGKHTWQRLKRCVCFVSVPSWNTDLELPHRKFSPDYWRIRDLCESIEAPQLITWPTVNHVTEIVLDLPATCVQWHEQPQAKPAEELPCQLMISWETIHHCCLKTLHFRVVYYRAINTWRAIWKECS